MSRNDLARRLQCARYEVEVTVPSSVLIVDDEALLARTLASALRDEGFDVVTAESAEDAARHLFPVNRFDVVLLDHRLPGATGVSILERMRAEGQRTPVILMTAFETVSMRSRALELGIAGFFRKPFNLREMLDQLETLAHEAAHHAAGADKTTS
jgi:DNA-binding response OmpR family regulator